MGVSTFWRETARLRATQLLGYFVAAELLFVPAQAGHQAPARGLFVILAPEVQIGLGGSIIADVGPRSGSGS